MSLSPQNALYWADLGTALDWEGKSNEALRAFEHSRELFPNSPDITWKLANFYIRAESSGNRSRREAFSCLGIFWTLWLTFRRCKKGGSDYDKAISFACLGSIVAILLHSLADFNLYIPGNALVFAIILALAWSSAHQTVDPEGMRRT